MTDVKRTTTGEHVSLAERERRAAEARREAAAAQLAAKLKGTRTGTSAPTLAAIHGGSGMDVSVPRSAALPQPVESKEPTFKVNAALVGNRLTKPIDGGVRSEVAAKGEFGADFKAANGVGVSFKATGSANATSEVVEKDGRTSFTFSAKVEGQLSGGVKAPIASVSGSAGAGADSKFQVSMPTEAFKALDPTKFNPLDASTWPAGTKVRMEASAFTSTAFAASFRNFSVETSSKDTQGHMLELEKLPDGKLKMTSGPNQAFDRSTAFGVNVGVASAKVGRADALAGSQIRTATFDLNTPDGKAAFHRALIDGHMPSTNGSGVSDVSKTERIDYTSSSSLKLGLGTLSTTLAGPENKGGLVVTTNADGTKDVTGTLRYSDGPALTVTRKFDKDGKELVDARRYALTVTPPDAQTAKLYNTVVTGSPNGPFKAGQPGTLNFTPEQMSQLEALDAKRLAGNPLASSPWTFRDARGRPETQGHEAYAIALARNLSGGPHGFPEKLFALVAADPRQPPEKFPGTAS